MLKAKLKFAGLGVAGALFCLMSNGALAGISNTVHNLSSTGTGPNKFSGTTEICVFCHTPHGSNNSASVPLWNKPLGGDGTGGTYNVTYTTYDDLGTSSLDGSVATVGSVSIACLSCHDGVQAMDTVLNEPGSGAVVASYSTSGIWTGASSPTGIALIGGDLTDDHPVGVVYAGGATGNDFETASALVDKDFKVAKKITVNQKDVWFVDTNSNSTREKEDIQLYTRTGAVLSSDGVTVIDAGALPFVECASCHDPHTENTTFLRVTDPTVPEGNQNSEVCLACHVK